MTGNTTQATLDAIDLLRGAGGDNAPAIRARLNTTMRSIVFFAAGCAIAAALYAKVGFWCLSLPVVVAAASATARIED
jgi:uncharacterized membrane protein YoaK (UPF0700 family)